MQHFWSLDDVSLERCWLTIGVFDGVHLGHQAVVRRLVEGARAVGAPAAVLTFFPHPAAVLRGQQEAFYLTSPQERAELLGELGVNTVITHPFTRELAQVDARGFLEMLQGLLHAEHILVGYDFALGRNREGNVARLGELSVEFGFQLDVLEPVQNGEETISSSQIRKALREGDVRLAERLLGRPYRLEGEIVHGDGRGRLIGIPTANLEVWTLRAIPMRGVYACRATIEGRGWGAVTNVGVRPTFENQAEQARVETHVLGLEEDLYGKHISLEFVERLRDERKFGGVEELVEQIRRDIEEARGLVD
jgi:riboflavin kinase/FMN adenylyltransferase